jgi:hypothetical protein
VPLSPTLAARETFYLVMKSDRSPSWFPLALAALLSSAAMAQTEAAEEDLRAIAQKAREKVVAAVPAGARIAFAPFFFDLSDSSFTLHPPEFDGAIKGPVTNRAAEAVRDVIVDGFGDAGSQQVEVLDGNEILARQIERIGFSRRAVDDAGAAAALILIDADYVICGEIAPSRRGRTWDIELRLQRPGASEKLVGESFRVGGQRAEGSLKADAERFARDRWGAAAPFEDTRLEAMNLVYAWSDRHRRDFLGSGTFLKALG